MGTIAAVIRISAAATTTARTAAGASIRRIPASCPACAAIGPIAALAPGISWTVIS